MAKDNSKHEYNLKLELSRLEKKSLRLVLTRELHYLYDLNHKEEFFVYEVFPTLFLVHLVQFVPLDHQIYHLDVAIHKNLFVERLISPLAAKEAQSISPRRQDAYLFRRSIFGE